MYSKLRKSSVSKKASWIPTPAHAPSRIGSGGTAGMQRTPRVSATRTGSATRPPSADIVAMSCALCAADAVARFMSRSAEANTAPQNKPIAMAAAASSRIAQDAVADFMSVGFPLTICLREFTNQSLEDSTARAIPSIQSHRQYESPRRHVRRQSNVHRPNNRPIRRQRHVVANPT